MRKTIALFALLLSTAAWCEPAPPTLMDCSASAQGDVRRPIVIEVTVENKGKEPSAEGSVEVTLKPQTRGRTVSGGTSVFSPTTLQGSVPALTPGQKQTIKINTPYESKNSFKGSKRNFKASNIDPTGSDVTVDFDAKLRSR